MLRAVGDPVGETLARAFLVESQLGWKMGDPRRGAVASMHARKVARELHAFGFTQYVKGRYLQALALFDLGLVDTALRVADRCLKDIGTHELDRTVEMIRGDLGLWLCAVGEFDSGLQALRVSLSGLVTALGQGDRIVERAAEMLREGESRHSQVHEIAKRHVLGLGSAPTEQAH